MLSDWWNGVELWMLGLPFPLQFALVVVVLVPLCLVVAWLIDRIVDHASAVFGPAASPEPPISSAEIEETDSEPEPAVEPAEPDVPAEEAVAQPVTEEPVTAQATESVDENAADRDERVPAESTGR